MGKLLRCLLVLMFVTNIAAAQQRTITGTVTASDTKEPLAGVTVKLQGKEKGIVTDATGHFSLTVSPGHPVLVFSHVGYTTKTETVGTSDVVNVVLSAGSKDLGEVVVTALGVKRTKRDLGYSTQTITGEQLLDRGDNNVLNLLQGKVAGIDITGASGSAGASTNIVLRGISSITGNNQPLFVVDGITISNNIDQLVSNTLFTNQPPNRVLDIDPNSIESINVMQGPAAAALYGSRASGGAIIITTKKGANRAGKTSVIFSSSYSVQNVYGFPELQNQYGAGSNGIYDPASTTSWGPAFGSVPSLLNGLIVSDSLGSTIEGVHYNKGDAIPYINYPKNMINYFSQGHTLDNNISITGGNAKNSYRLSIGRSSADGILPSSEFNKFNTAFSATSQITDKMGIGGSITYYNTFQDQSTTQGNGTPSAMDQLFAVTRSTNFKYYKEHYKNDDGTNNWFVAGRDNPYFAAYENSITTKLDRFQGSVNVSYDVFKWLKAIYRLGIDAYINRGKYYVAIGSTQEAASSGSITDRNFYNREINGDLILTANKNDVFTKGLNLTALLGQNINTQDYQRLTAASSGLAIPGYYNVSNGQNFSNTDEFKRQKRLLGFYSQLSFAYKNYLFLELTGRVDKSSTLPSSNNTYFYPSVSGGFVFTDAFNLKTDLFSYGKIRAAYARVGKDADPYSLDSRTYGPASYGNNVGLFNFPYGSVVGFAPTGRIGNPGLKPELTYAYEFGLNLGFFKDRLTMEATVYNQGSNNQIINIGIAPSSGYTSMVNNIGEISNKGIELLVSAIAVKTKNLTWNISGNFSKNKNKVISLAPGINSFTIPGNNFAAVIPSAVVGLPYGVILGNKQPRSPDGQLIVDPNTGLYSTAVLNAQLMADPNTDWKAGLTNLVKYKNFFISALVDLKVGGDISSWTTAILRSRGALAVTAEDRDKPHILPGVIANADGTYSPNNIQITAQQYWQTFGGAAGNEFNIFDATTFRFRELSLGYDLRGKVLRSKAIKNIRISVFGRNLFYYAPNCLIDPEVSTQGAGNIRGIELESAPNTRTFGASINVTL